MVRHSKPGDWMDEMGSCKVCMGEIPYGHTADCHIWKQDQRIAALEACLDWAMVAVVENYESGIPPDVPGSHDELEKSRARVIAFCNAKDREGEPPSAKGGVGL